MKRQVFSFTSAYFQGHVNLKQTAYPSTSTLSMVLQNSLYSICQTVVYLVIADPLEKKCRNYASLTFGRPLVPSVGEVIVVTAVMHLLTRLCVR